MDEKRSLFVSLICVLLGVGVVMVHSASITSWPTEYEQVYLSRHLAFLLFGAAVATTCTLLPRTFWFRIAPWFFLFTCVLLGLVLVPGIGTRVNGSQRWIRAGGLSLQPSELAKIALTLFVVRLLVSRKSEGLDWATVWKLSATVGIMVPLVLLEPDLGTSAFLTCSLFIALFLGGVPIRYFVVSLGLLVPLAAGLVAFKPYQAARITGFLQTWRDMSQAPWQLKQSILSLGAGGLFGTGVGRGSQKLSFLPEANTDFVFAVVGEELGLVGTLAVLFTWAGVFIVGTRIVNQMQRGTYERVAAMTLLSQIVFQAALNVAVVTAMVPPKGFAHPLLSYGGSNLITTLAAFGIILGLSIPRQVATNVSRNSENEKKEAEIAQVSATDEFVDADDSEHELDDEVGPEFHEEEHDQFPDEVIAEDSSSVNEPGEFEPRRQENPEDDIAA